jgi:hypothetical protein
LFVVIALKTPFRDVWPDSRCLCSPARRPALRRVHRAARDTSGACAGYVRRRMVLRERCNRRRRAERACRYARSKTASTSRITSPPPLRMARISMIFKVLDNARTAPPWRRTTAARPSSTERRGRCRGAARYSASSWRSGQETANATAAHGPPQWRGSARMIRHMESLLFSRRSITDCLKNALPIYLRRFRPLRVCAMPLDSEI